MRALQKLGGRGPLGQQEAQGFFHQIFTEVLRSECRLDGSVTHSFEVSLDKIIDNFRPRGQCDQAWLQQAKARNARDGTTACTVLVSGTDLFCANVGMFLAPFERDTSCDSLSLEKQRKSHFLSHSSSGG